MSSLFSRTIQHYKEAYSGHPRQVWALAVLTLINRMGTMVLPFLSVYLTTILGFSLKEVGFIASAFGFGSLAGSFIGGKLSDKIGANLIILISMFVSGTLLILMQFATSLESLFAFIFITALFGEAFRPAVMAAMGQYVGKAKTGRTVALLRLAINLGMSVAPAIGGFVAATIGYSWLFVIDGSTCIAAAVYFLWVSRRWRKQNEEIPPAVEEVTEEEDSMPPYRNPDYLVFLLATFVMGFAFVQWFHTVPVFIKSEWGFDERYIGILMACSSLIITLIEMPIVHSIEKKQKISIAIFIGLALLAASFLPFLLPKALLWCFVAMLLFTMGEILFFPFNGAIPLNLSPQSKRGEYMAWYWMAWSLTAILGPSLGFLFIDACGFSAFWGLLVVLISLGLGINIWKRDKIT